MHEYLAFSYVFLWEWKEKILSRDHISRINKIDERGLGDASLNILKEMISESKNSLNILKLMISKSKNKSSKMVKELGNVALKVLKIKDLRIEDTIEPVIVPFSDNMGRKCLSINLGLCNYFKHKGLANRPRKIVDFMKSVGVGVILPFQNYLEFKKSYYGICFDSSYVQKSHQKKMENTLGSPPLIIGSNEMTDEYIWFDGKGNSIEPSFLYDVFPKKYITLSKSDPLSVDLDPMELLKKLKNTKNENKTKEAKSNVDVNGKKTKNIAKFRGAELHRDDIKVLKELESLKGEEFSEVSKIEGDTKMGFTAENNQVSGLGLYKCGLTTLPESIGNLTSLTYLNLESNSIKTLPESIGNLKSLKELLLSNNGLRTLPESIGNLNSLKELWLWNRLHYVKSIKTFAEKLLNIAEKRDNSFYKAEAYYFQGYSLLMQNKREKLRDALNKIRDAAVIFDNINDFIGAAVCFHKIGSTLHSKLHNYKFGVTFYREAIKNYNNAIVKSHPLRKTLWSQKEKIKQKIFKIKKIIEDILPKVKDEEIKNRMKKDLSSIDYNF